MGGAASSQGDFSGLIGSARCSAKVFFVSAEFDHLVKHLFKVLEVFSFLDWMIGALARKIEEHDVPVTDLASDWLCLIPH